MKFTTPKLCCSLLLASALLPLSPTLHADELKISILKATSEEGLKALTKDLSFVEGDFEGISVLEEAEVAIETESESPPEVEGESFVQAEDYQGETFNEGDYIMICFTPPVNLHLRIMDTAPNGKQSQLFPSDGSIAHKVKGGTRYCVGDKNSDTLLQMDHASGLGKGRVWIIGTSSKDKAEDLTEDQFSLPAVGTYGKSAAGSISKIAVVKKIEGWVTYEVK